MRFCMSVTLPKGGTNSKKFEFTGGLGSLQSMIRIVLLLLALVLVPTYAVEIDQSKKTVPDKFVDPGAKRFSIFSGDPKRIQRANAIDFADMETKITVTPNPLSLKSAEEAPSGRPSIKVTLTVRNKGKRTYTLSFPNSQRYDIQVKSASGQVVYAWSSDKEFVEQIGTILINPSDIISYSETLALGEFSTPPAPGAYSVEVAVSNYPELSARTPITINP